MPKKYALLVDLRKCVGCTSCQVSCKMENSVPLGRFRSKVDIADVGDYPKPRRYFFPKISNQCEEPPCIVPCPVKGATYRREDGVVMVNRDLCIGCGRCVGACPYGARFMHPHIPVSNDPGPYAKTVTEVKGKKAVGLLATGLDTFSRLTYNKALSIAGESETVLYAISMGQLVRMLNEDAYSSVTRSEFLVADLRLKPFAKRTGGFAMFPRFTSEYPAVFRNVNLYLRFQYTLAYQPSNQKLDGKTGKIKVEAMADSVEDERAFFLGAFD